MKYLLTTIGFLSLYLGCLAQTASVTIPVSASDQDGTIVSYKWTQLSGPNTSVIVPGDKSTTISNLIVGTYKIQCVVTDNQNATGSGSIFIYVKDQNTPPVIIINGGRDTTIQIPGVKATGLRFGNSIWKPTYPINTTGVGSLPSYANSSEVK